MIGIRMFVDEAIDIDGQEPAVGPLTALSGVVVLVRMYETHPPAPHRHRAAT
jgi:hypothetical protein